MTTRLACFVLVLVALGCSGSDRVAELLQDSRQIAGDFNRYAYDLKTFPDGSYVIIGSFEDSITLGAGEPNETTFTAGPFDDGFIACFGPNHALRWASSMQGSNDVEPCAIDPVPVNNKCVVLGRFHGSVVLGVGEPNETTLESTQLQGFEFEDDLFVASYNADGTLAWAAGLGGASSEAPGGVAAYADGSVAVAGRYTTDISFARGTPNETTLSNDAARSMFVARYGPDGTFAWARTVFTDFDTFASALTLLSDGSVAVLGEYDGETVFEAGTANEKTIAGEEQDIFIARFSDIGDCMSVFTAAGTDEVRLSAVREISPGVVVIAGSFRESLTLGEGANQTTLDSNDIRDMFLACVDLTGASLRWATSAGGVGNEDVASLAVHPDGTLLVAGHFRFDFAIGSATFNNPESEEVFVAGYSSLGAPLWAFSGGGSQVDRPAGIAALADGSIIATGNFIGPAMFAGQTLPGVANGDIFIAVYRP